MDLKRMVSGLRSFKRTPELFRCALRSPDWLAISSAYLGIRPLHYPRDWTTPDGHAVTFQDYHDLTTAWVIYHKLEYHIDPTCRTIVDAGANIGLFSLFAAARAPESKIVALEPFPSSRARLEDHIIKNRLEHRISIRPWALNRADGTRYMDGSPHIPSISRSVLGEDSKHSGEPVTAVSLSSLLDQEGFERVDFLKLDIEGSEHEVLLSTPVDVLKRIRTIGMEYHSTAPKSTLFRALNSAGFKLLDDRPTQPDSGVAHFQGI